MLGRDFIPDTETPNRKWLQTYIHPDDQEQVVAVIRQAIRNRSVFELEHRIRRVDGSLGWTYSRAVPILDDKGQILEWFGCASDITERKWLERQLLEAGEREQQRIGHDLHDGLGQELHGLCYLANLLARELEHELPRRAPEAKRLARLLGEVFQLARKLAHGLQPVSPVPEGLMLTLRGLAHRTRDLYGLDCRFQCAKPVLIQHHGAATHLYRIAQEAVNNATKHGHPTRVRIQLARTPHGIVLRVCDNGVGIRSKKGGLSGMGLHIMQYRSEAIRGALVVQKRPEGGTEVVCSVPRLALRRLEESSHANHSPR